MIMKNGETERKNLVQSLIFMDYKWRSSDTLIHNYHILYHFSLCQSDYIIETDTD